MNGLEERFESLFRRRQAGMKYSLDGIRRLCEALGNLQEGLKFIHIAGTNGKGSVAAMCASILQEAGLRTGLYTSPHLLKYHERFRMDGLDISDSELRPLLEKILSLDRKTSFFEISTALALLWFQNKKTEVAVWETGLGGRLDATNIVQPAVAVITQIGIEHTQFLGNTLEEITREKAGILKTGAPCIFPRQDEKVVKILLQRAAELKAPVTLIKESDLDEFEPPLLGNHQRWNTALAVAAAKQFVPALSSENIKKGLKKTRWPGRCQFIERDENRPPILLDGAHNPLGARSLADEIQRRWPGLPVTLIFGALGDKNIMEIGRILAPLTDQVFLTPVQSERSVAPETLQKAFPAGKWTSCLSEAFSLADSLKYPIIMTGSLFLVGEALNLLEGGKQTLHPAESLLVR